MPRTYTEDFLAAAKVEDQKCLEEFDTTLNRYINDFQWMLQELRKQLKQKPLPTLPNNINDPNNRGTVELSEDSQVLQNYIETLTVFIDSLENYKKKIRYANAFGAKLNKMTKIDITILGRHLMSVNQLYVLVDSFVKNENKTESKTSRESIDASGESVDVPEKTPAQPKTQTTVREQSSFDNKKNGESASAPSGAIDATKSLDQIQNKSLSALISNSAQLEYQISYSRIWLRRILFLVGSLLAAAAAITIMTILMTPGVNIGAVLITIPTMLLASLAFFYFRKPVYIPESFNVGEVDFNVKVPLFSTLFTAIAGAIGITHFKKLPVTTKPREIAARNLAVDTVNCLTDELRKKINAINNNDVVKQFLLSVIDKADKMYNNGAKSTIYERRTSRMQKGRLILSETAKLVEAGIDDKTTVQVILNSKISLDYTYGQLLNAQRNTFSFWKRTTSTITGLALAATEFKDCKEVTTRVHFKTLSAALNSAG